MGRLDAETSVGDNPHPGRIERESVEGVQTAMTVLPALAGALLGGIAGWGIRLLLASLRRGAVLLRGVAELMAAVITGVGTALVWPGPMVALVVWAGLLAVALGAVDVMHHRLPDALTLPAIPITLLLIVAVEAAAPATGSVGTALVVAVVVTGLFWALAAALPQAMGLGDVKLMPSLALMTGYVSVASAVLAVMLAFVLGALVALFGLAVRRFSMTSAIPFGPCLLAGCWLVLAVPGLVRVVIG